MSAVHLSSQGGATLLGNSSSPSQLSASYPPLRSSDGHWSLFLILCDVFADFPWGVSSSLTQLLSKWRVWECFLKPHLFCPGQLWTKRSFGFSHCKVKLLKSRPRIMLHPLLRFPAESSPLPCSCAVGGLSHRDPQHCGASICRTWRALHRTVKKRTQKHPEALTAHWETTFF